jgi:cytochrome c oxidase cbb3-type subunit 2
MAQDLERVPPAFVALAGLAFALLAVPGFRRLRPAVAACVLAGALARPLEAETPLLARGREVYIAEGCIHCHSQYIRPGTADTVRWGPATPLAESPGETPPLYGNRRQGPDLAQVGARRSEAWNRLHLVDPRSLSPGSRMPAYARLFAEGDTRGEALVAYLASLGAGREDERAARIAAWKPEPDPQAAPGGAGRYAALCASCHGADGRGDGPLAAGLGLRLPDFRSDAWRHVRGDDEIIALMRIVKFGLPGTLMAGHEYLADADVFALALHVRGLHDGSVSTTDP